MTEYINEVEDREYSIEERQFPIIPSPVDERDYTESDFPDLLLGAELLPENYEGVECTIKNQGATSMCAAFTLATIKEIQEKKERGVTIQFSPGFIYANRQFDNYTGEGLYMRSAVADLRRWGTVEWKEFLHVGKYPKVREEFDKVKHLLLPKAEGQRIKSYVSLSINNIKAIKRAIYDHGAVAFGTALYESFDKTITVDGVKGVVPMPKKDEKRLGGHAMAITGWKVIQGKLHWKLVNSWGYAWGNMGIGYIPYDYPALSEYWALVDQAPGDRSSNIEVRMKLPRKRGLTPDFSCTVRTEKGYGLHKLKYGIILHDNRTYISIRDFSEILQYGLEYDKETHTAIITKDGE